MPFLRKRVDSPIQNRLYAIDVCHLRDYWLMVLLKNELLTIYFCHIVRNWENGINVFDITINSERNISMIYFFILKGRLNFMPFL